MIRSLALVGTVCLLAASNIAVMEAYAGSPEPAGAFNVRSYGATGDSATKDTAAVQRAIDACAAGGGGTVYFPYGMYLCGSLHLRSGVTLFLDNGATIMGSKENDDYDPYEKLEFKNAADTETTYFHFALVWGEDVERVGIVGHGTIDSNRESRHGPKTIALKRCRFVEIRGIRLVNAPNYNLSMLGTDFVNIDGVTILNGYADGIDPDACHNVRIANCHIESVDDAIVPKASFSLGERRSCENITVTNCYLATACNCFKLGTESGGDFKRIAVSNCVMAGLKGHRPASGGIALETVDGSNLEGVVVSNVTMVDVRAPIFIRLGNRGRDMDTPVPGTLRDVIISNVAATDASNTCTISGIPGHNVERVTLSNVEITFKGGCPYRPSDEPVPESIAEYPDPDIFDALPAYGLYCRHVDGLTLSNVQVRFTEDYWRLKIEEGSRTKWDTPDGIPTPSAPGHPGHALVCDDVSRLDVDGLRGQASPDGVPVMRFVNVRDALVRGCAAPEKTKVFLEVLGDATRGVNLVGNVMTSAETPVVVAKEVKAGSVSTDAGKIGVRKASHKRH